MPGHRKSGGAGQASGTAGGTDLEPLRGGMRESERGVVGPEHGHAPRRGPSKEPAGGAERGSAVHRRRGSARREGAPPRPGSEEAGDTRRDPGEKIVEEREDHANEAGNAPSYGAPHSSER
jgi:hypothetical protein